MSKHRIETACTSCILCSTFDSLSPTSSFANAIQHFFLGAIFDSFLRALQTNFIIRCQTQIVSLSEQESSFTAVAFISFSRHSARFLISLFCDALLWQSLCANSQMKVWAIGHKKHSILYTPHICHNHHNRWLCKTYSQV